MALVLTSLVDLLHVHADLKIDRIHLNARDEFLLSRAFSLGHHRNFWISALLIQSPNLNIATGSDPAPISSTIAHADSLLSMFSGKLPYHVKPSSATGRDDGQRRQYP